MRIRDSQLVIADLSEARPNVLFEAGYAEALERPVLYISSSLPESAPFDVRHNKIFGYQLGQTKKLSESLTSLLKDNLP